MRERWRQFQSLPPDEQSRVRQNFQRFRQLPPEQRQRLRNRWQRMTPAQRKQLREQLRERRAAAPRRNPAG